MVDPSFINIMTHEGGLVLRIFIDSANIEEIREINDLGFLAGVTTNPSLVAKEKGLPSGSSRNLCDC